MSINKVVARLELLDVYRGLSILSVLLYHYTNRLSNDYLFFDYSPRQFSFCYLGVPSFFAVSGFCSYLTIERSNNWRHFLAKRFARLWPALVVCCLITQIVVQYYGLPSREIGWIEMAGSILI